MTKRLQEISTCRTILDVAGDHSSSIHGGIDALVQERHYLRGKLAEALAQLEEQNVANCLTKDAQRQTISAEARIFEMENLIKDMVDCDWDHGFSEDIHSETCRKCAILRR